MNSIKKRLNPDKILEKIKDFENKKTRGKLKIFFGACPGVGKTYSMLLDAKMRYEEGVDVIAGIIETHGRDETAKLLSFIPQIAIKKVQYQNIILEEFDLDETLKRKPAIVLIDELAHTNSPNMRHPKRWNDIIEVLNAGIDVYTTLNVQHLESLNDIIASITGVIVKETVPDSIFDNADDIVLVDINSDELLRRLKKGKVYINEEIRSNAANNFFKKENIIALRELALRRTAQRVDAQMEDYVIREGIGNIDGTAYKIMACIGPDVLSARIVRSAKRMANSLKVPWIVVYVENSRHLNLSEKEKSLIESCFRLAKRNGAQNVILYGENAAEEILSYAHSNDVDKIIIGKSNEKSRFRDIIFGSLAEKLIRKSGIIDIYVITPSIFDKRENKSKKFIINFGYYGGTLLIVALCTIFGKILDNFLAPIDQVMIYLIGAVLVAAQYGRGASILFSLLSVTSFNFFFIEPYYSFNVINKTYWLTLLVMLLTSLFIATQAAKLSAQAFISRKREQITQKFYNLTKELAKVRGHQKIAEISAQKIAEAFEAKVAIWTVENHSSNQLKIILGKDKILESEKEKAVANWCFKNATAAGIGTDTMPSAAGLYLPLMILNKIIGVIAIYPNLVPRIFTTEERASLEIFADLLSSGLERANIALEAEETKIKVETEKMRSLLLSSVSHDLRTPLASIIGASETIKNNKKLSKKQITELAFSINSESLRLSKIIRNILDATNIETGNLKLNKQPYYLQEIIGAAFARMKELFAFHKVDIKCEDNLPMVMIDGVLIEQVITNLLENAAKYTPAESLINISLKKEAGGLRFAIEDNGPGILPKGKNKEEKKEGYGLGLIICHGIIKAHDSELEIQNSKFGGARFSFILEIY